MIDLAFLSQSLTARFGLQVEVRTARTFEGKTISVSPSGIPPTKGFRIDYLLGWRRITASFIPGSFAQSLILGIKSCSRDQKALFELFAESLSGKGARITVRLDGTEYSAIETNSWPTNWTSIEINMSILGLVEVEPDYTFENIFPFVSSFLGLCLSLLPLDQNESDFEEGGESEGASFLSEIKRYERSRINRAACIEIYGTDCSICGYNFGVTFGKEGEGLIHVHHILPVSLANGSYRFDPRKDLIPVCPNCHAMLHRKHPPYLPEELKQLLRRHR
ncbi:MAG: hypothetical protein GYA22_04210 [Bacteroidales bacterium]|nr:hypothetical protein [Bacteroidales bacterium]